MNLKLQTTFSNHWLKLDKVFELMLYSIKGRLNKYWNWNIWISRKEFSSEIYKGLNITENQFKNRIKKLKDLGFLIWWGKQYSRKPAKYSVSEILLWIFKLFETWKEYIKDLSNKIIKFVEETDTRTYLQNLWHKFKNFKQGILSKKKGEKITVGWWQNNWCVSIWWKETKHYNLFNFLKESYKLNILEMCNILEIK